MQDCHLNMEIPTEERSSFLERTKLALRTAMAVEEGIQEGVQHPLSTTSAPSAWRAQLQCGPAHPTGCSGSPQSQALLSREGRWIKTDAKPVYCVYYAAVSGVMYLNPSASRQGNAPHAVLLVDSDPFNSLFKIQQLLPCHGKKTWCAPKSRRA